MCENDNCCKQRDYIGTLITTVGAMTLLKNSFSNQLLFGKANTLGVSLLTLGSAVTLYYTFLENIKRK
tara:strand:+ start:193 stop:396 length:204 start_codon:yes stop_codon:yes gene_type:complete